MIIDGNAIADDIVKNTALASARAEVPVTLAIVVVGENALIEHFIAFKMKRAAEAGVGIRRIDFSNEARTKDIVKTLTELGQDASVSGIVVQLPLPSHIDAKTVCDAVVYRKDADVLSSEGIAHLKRGDALVLPPVVGAMQTILNAERITVAGKHAFVIGRGMLVGAPAAVWLAKEGAEVSVADKTTQNLSALTRAADVIVSGAGVPDLITPDMLKEGVMLFDAGTSEQEGVVKGDARPDCASKCRIFTPVPGGIGPITVAVLLQNTVTLLRGTIGT